ncbi:MAG: PIG-L family deacetylase [Balneolaceae bacterium]
MAKISDKNNHVVLAIVAHPDDIEILCAGTLSLLRQKGWQVQMATMTAGDCGSREHGPEEISKIRKEEAVKAAAMIDAGYHCLECKDLFIMYDRPTLLKTIRLIRQLRPEIVLTMSPSCYMIDHEMTSKIVQTACFAAGAVNVNTDDVPPYFHIPHLYYLDPIEGKDKFGTIITPDFVVDITTVIDQKKEMLACHESQRKWLLEHHGMDAYLEAMKKMSAERGEFVNVKYGEGFRQHLGHAYPQHNLLLKELEDFAQVI